MHKITVYSNDAADLSHVVTAIRKREPSCAAIEARWFDGRPEKTERVVFVSTGDPLDAERFAAISKAYKAAGLAVEDVRTGNPEAIADALFTDAVPTADPDAVPTADPDAKAKAKAAAKAAKLAAAEAKAAGGDA